MSLVLAPYGMRPAFHPSGVVTRTEQGTINPAAPFIHHGDLVSLAADGTLVRATPGAGNLIVGVFDGVEYRDGTGRPNVSRCWPAHGGSYDITAYFTSDPDLVYEIQANGPVTRDMVGSHASFVAGVSTPANTMTGVSCDMLDVASISNTVANQLAIVGIREYPDNTWGDAYTTVLVKIAQHQRAAALPVY